MSSVQELDTDNQVKDFKRCVPVNLTKYANLYGLKATGAILGRSDSCIGRWVKYEECPVDAELACTLLLEKKLGPNKDRVAIISASNDILNAIEAMIKGVGGKYHIIP